MAMTQYTASVEVITNLGTTPQERGLTTEQFKAKFDEGLKAFVTWFNDTHKTEFDAHLAESAAKHIKESGSNVNGNYIKFDDGTMICTKTVSTSTSVNTAEGAVYVNSSNINWTMPAAFISEPSVIISPHQGWSKLMGLTISTISFRIMAVTSLSSSYYTCIAIGRWKA